jgi:hypothetical protein
VSHEIVLADVSSEQFVRVDQVFTSESYLLIVIVLSFKLLLEISESV